MSDRVWIGDLKTLIDSEAVIVAEEETSQYSYDAWPIAEKWKQQGKQPHSPDVIVRPTNTAVLCRIVKWANAQDIPITPRGAGSGVTGAALSTRGGIMLDMTAMDRTLMLDETNLLVKVQAGKMGHILEHELNARGYTLNHSPQSLDRSSVGGWVATRAMGQFSSRWGGIEDLALAFSVVLPTGELIETKSAPRAAIGPDLRHIFMGSEGTMGIVTDITLKIFPVAEYRRFEALAFTSLEAGVSSMGKIMRQGLRPFLVRFYDEDEARHAMQDSQYLGCVMFLGFEGIQSVAEAEYAASLDICGQEGGQVIGAAPVTRWMDRRFDFSTIENVLATPGGVAETIEVAHFWDSILETYHALKQALDPLAEEVLGHFSHVYPQGTSLYIILLGQAQNDADAETRIMQIWDTAMRICLEKGAAISHHHGVGLARQSYVRDDLSSSALVLDRVKAAMDPSGIMNPGKLGFS